MLTQYSTIHVFFNPYKRENNYNNIIEMSRRMHIIIIMLYYKLTSTLLRAPLKIYGTRMW